MSKVMRIFYFISLFGVFGSIAAAQVDLNLNKQTVESLIQYYRPEILARYGQDVQVTFHRQEVLQALGGWRDDNIVIDIYQKILRMERYLLVAALCHELGHILGHVNFSSIPSAKSSRLDNVEGEADYFGGKCLADWFQREGKGSESQTLAFLANKSCLETIYGETIDIEKAKATKSNETELGYPLSECRLLSAYNGIFNLPRPECWYVN